MMERMIHAHCESYEKVLLGYEAQQIYEKVNEILEEESHSCVYIETADCLIRIFPDVAYYYANQTRRVDVEIHPRSGANDEQRLFNVGLEIAILVACEKVKLHEAKIETRYEGWGGVAV